MERIAIAEQSMAGHSQAKAQLSGAMLCKGVELLRKAKAVHNRARLRKGTAWRGTARQRHS